MGKEQLATITVTKLKECPTLEVGKITPAILQTWYHSVRRFAKLSGKKIDSEVVPFAADACLEPRLASWYVSDSDRIDKLTLAEYIQELADLVLEKNWAHHLRQEILTSRQPEATTFMDWRIELENKNALLRSSAPTFIISDDAFRPQLETNARPALCLSLSTKPISPAATY